MARLSLVTVTWLYNSINDYLHDCSYDLKKNELNHETEVSRPCIWLGVLAEPRVISV